MTTHRNVFDLSHERKFTLEFGLLTPCFFADVVPGDTFKVKPEMFVRVAPLVAPVMHRVNIYVHYFFVPYRLVWDDWQTFITGIDQKNTTKPAPVDLTIPTLPYKLEATDLGLGTAGTLSDYLGIGDLSASNQIGFYPRQYNSTDKPNYDPQTDIRQNIGTHPGEVSALPFRAYHLIYNEWYRDEDLQPPSEFSTASYHFVPPSGISQPSPISQAEYDTLVSLRTRNWEKDYFTSARPWPQKGGEASLVLDKLIGVGRDKNADFANGAYLGTFPGARDVHPPFSSLRAGGAEEPTDASLFAGVTGMTINDLRNAFQVQKWMERAARGGSRYIEAILSHFGVKSSDSRLQRPEFLGGSKVPIQISEVLQTNGTATADTSGLGAYAGHGIASGSGRGFKRFFEEHGCILGIMSVLPRIGYQDVTNRYWFKSSKFDFYWPEFAHLGEQGIFRAEMPFHRQTDQSPQALRDLYIQNYGLFYGYTGRWNEYRDIPSTLHGDFKLEAMKAWTLDRRLNKTGYVTAPNTYSSVPTLNGGMIEAYAAELNRIFQNTSWGHDQSGKFFVELYNKVHAIRPMPHTSVPGFVDHF